MNYIATEEQLTAIADAIRAKVDIDPSASYAAPGKNLLNPDLMYAEGLPRGKYTFSMRALVDGTQPVPYEMDYGTQPNEYVFSGFNIGDRVSFGINLLADVRLTFADSTDFTDYQLESGEVATDYEPYTVKLRFPDGFVEAINSIE